MQHILTTLLLVSGILVSNLEAAENKPIKIYLCSRLTEESKAWNDEICTEFNQNFVLFRPQDIDLSHLLPLELDLAAYQADMEGIVSSHLLLVLPPYGRDCAWEIGWFCGHNKPTIAYVETPGDWTRDAMVKGGLNAIITNNGELYKQLLDDPSLQNKCHLISSRNNLTAAITAIYNRATLKIK